ENWRDYVKVPDLIANCSDGWEEVREKKKQIEDEGFISATIMGTGVFEQLHMLMTFEDTLCNLILYPDEIKEMIEVIAEYRMTYFKLIVENLHPQLIISHDDWGSNAQLFMEPDMWREYFKETYRRFYDYLHENDIIVMHHSDSFCEPIAEDMADIGVDIWQGVLPSNDIVGLTERLNGRMALMGGWDSAVDREDATEEEIRRETRRACDEYGHLKMFIPSITYGDPFGTIYPKTKGIVVDEVNRYNLEKYGHCMTEQV
ncbi:MAG: uroporphyrinogen decarboxylase (URO-D), partial [Eubacterium sp.]|nr:uroporphyrinogen decarboxylase (URO-D) [Eubacterium sp.]